MVGEHGGFGEAGGSGGELEVADEVGEDFGFGVVEALGADFEALFGEVVVGC